VLSGRTQGAWSDISSRFDGLKKREPSEATAHEILDLARSFMNFCAGFTGESSEVLAAAAAGR